MSRPFHAAVLAALGLVLVQPLTSPTATADAQERRAIGHREGQPFSPAVEAGNTIYFSGRLGLDEEVRELDGEERVRAETRNIMEGFRELFAEAGVALEDAVSATVYLADIDDFRAFNEVYTEYFPVDPPARATVAVEDLVAGARVEISFIAVKP